MTHRFVALAFALLACTLGNISPARAQLGELTERFIGIGCNMVPDGLRTGIAALSIYPQQKLDMVEMERGLDLLIRDCAEKLADFSCSPQVVELLIAIAGMAPADTTRFLDPDEMVAVAGICGLAGTASWLTGIGGGFTDTAAKCGMAYAAYQIAAGVYQANSCTSRSNSVHDIANRLNLPMSMTMLPGENFELAVQQAINTAARSGQITQEEARAVRAEIATRRRIITGN